MMQPMDDAAFAIKGLGNQVEKLIIAFFVFSPDGVGNKVGILDAARSSGIDEKRNIGQVSHCTPAMPVVSELGGQRLQSGFLRRFVQDNKTLMVVSLAIQTIKEQIESAANLLKGVFYGIFGGALVFVHHCAEKTPLTCG